jgi:hypothetical protein
LASLLGVAILIDANLVDLYPDLVVWAAEVDEGGVDQLGDGHGLELTRFAFCRRNENGA